MRYVGGKARIAKWVADNVLTHTDRRGRYVEPFVGAAATFVALAPRFATSYASDAKQDLIMMWQKAVEGWPDIPRTVTREHYAQLRSAPPSAERGLIGFGASFGGKWFGGYTDAPWDKFHNKFTKPHLNAAADSVLRAAAAFKGAELVCCDYKSVAVAPDDVVYCDPPYEGTTGYGLPFDSAEFWATAEGWARTGAVVIVSESKAPLGWKALATRTRKHMLQVATDGTNESRVEALWVPS